MFLAHWVCSGSSCPSHPYSSSPHIPCTCTHNGPPPHTQGYPLEMYGNLHLPLPGWEEREKKKTQGAGELRSSSRSAADFATPSGGRQARPRGPMLDHVEVREGARRGRPPGSTKRPPGAAGASGTGGGNVYEGPPAILYEGPLCCKCLEAFDGPNVACVACGAVYHYPCLGMIRVPVGDWTCGECVKVGVTYSCMCALEACAWLCSSTLLGHALQGRAADARPDI